MVMMTSSPLAIRALWILNENGQLVLAKRFPTVEKKQQSLLSSSSNSSSSSSSNIHMNMSSGNLSTATTTSVSSPLSSSSPPPPPPKQQQHQQQQPPFMSNINSMSDALLVKTYLCCLEKVISDQLSNECFLMFSLKFTQKRSRAASTATSSALTTSMLHDTGDDFDTNSISEDVHSYDSDQEDAVDEFLIWPLIAIVVGGISLIALPFMDLEDCTKFTEFYKSQMTDLQKKDSQIFHFTNTFKKKCVVTTHKLPFSSHQNNNDSTNAFDLIDLTNVTGTLCLLQDLSSIYFMAKNQPKPSVSLPQFAHLDPAALYIQMFLSQCMPFGRPIETSPTNVHLLLTRPLSYRVDTFDRKRPSWRSHEIQIPHDKQRISFIVREIVESVQYDKEKIPDVWSCHGSVMCIADVSGFPDISIQLSHLANINHFSAHRCCSQYPQTLHPTTPFNLVFSPPPGGFVLCKYNVCDETNHVTSSQNLSLPLRGFYQMREFKEGNVDAVEILVQLKLDKTASNNFEFCNVYIPFPNKEIISDVKLLQNPLGQVTKSNSGHALIWKLGAKFKSKNLEVVLAAKIFFHSSAHTSQAHQESSQRKKDPLLVGSNAYIKLSYKMLDYSLSGIVLDSKSVSTSPASQFAQVLVKHEIVSNNCMIWNSIAQDVRYVA